MKALDTNVLVRFLVKDDPAQAEIIYRKLKQAEIDGEVFFVPLLVVLEMIWVLDSVYKIPRQEMVDSLEALLRMPVLKVGIPGRYPRLNLLGQGYPYRPPGLVNRPVGKTFRV